MGIVSKNGLFSGRIGNLVYYIVKGKQYVRTYTKPCNPRTPEQQRHRAKIKSCGEFLSPFKKVILIGYQGSLEGMEEFNECIKYHLANAMEETTPPGSEKFSFRVIPEKVNLSRGDIQQPEIYSCTRNGSEITFSWIPELGRISNRLTDTMAVVAYSPGKQVFTDFHAGTRTHGTGTIILPPDYTSSVLIWAFYWNGQKSAEPNRRNVSDSVYLGIF